MEQVASSSSFTTEQAHALFELSKTNIERVDYWITWMLALGSLIIAIITILLALIAYLTWKHIRQAKGSR